MDVIVSLTEEFIDNNYIFFVVFRANLVQEPNQISKEENILKV